jgi:hypothetical protein
MTRHLLVPLSWSQKIRNADRPQATLSAASCLGRRGLQQAQHLFEQEQVRDAVTGPFLQPPSRSNFRPTAL